MASYYFNIVNDGTGIFTPVARRGGTATTSGTALTLPAAELFPSTTSTKLLGLAIDACFRAIINNLVSFPASSYYINVVDDGFGVFTPAAIRDGTASSGGTTLTLPNGELFPSTTATKLSGLAVGALKRAALNDRAAGN